MISHGQTLFLKPGLVKKISTFMDEISFALIHYISSRLGTSRAESFVNTDDHAGPHSTQEKGLFLGGARIVA